MRPLILSDSFSIAASSKVEPSEGRLRNPDRRPMLIDEVRIRFPTADRAFEAAALRVAFHLGGAPLTLGHIPVGVLGRSYMSRDQSKNVSQPDVVWRPSRPILVPGAEWLRAQFFYDNSVRDFMDSTYGVGTSAPYFNELPVVLTYVCRVFDNDGERPSRAFLPWVAAWSTPPVSYLSPTTAITDAGEFESTESDLVNALDSPMMVRRFTGRAYMCRAYGADGPSPPKLDLLLPDLLDSYITAADSSDNILVRDPTPFGHVFNRVPACWDVSAKLPPKGYYLFRLHHLPRSGFVSNPDASGVSVWTDLAMHGYREVEVQW